MTADSDDRPARSRSSADDAPPPAEQAGSDQPAGERLQKLLSAAGLGSRRQCEELILAGRVTVNGQTVVELGTRADPKRDEIRVDGETIRRRRAVYFMVNKPVGVVTTNSDPAGRPRVVDLVPRDHDHLFAIGRLDLSSEGLILVTNDGELANQLTHPRYGVEKTYQVVIAGKVNIAEMEQLKKGVFLAEGFARVVRFTVRSQQKKSSVVELVLNEGRNREIRRLLARVGHKVLALKRIAVAGLRLGLLPVGACRPLRGEEVKMLREAAQEARKKHRRGPGERFRVLEKPGSRRRQKKQANRPPVAEGAEEQRSVRTPFEPGAERTSSGERTPAAARPPRPGAKGRPARPGQRPGQRPRAGKPGLPAPDTAGNRRGAGRGQGTGRGTTGRTASGGRAGEARSGQRPAGPRSPNSAGRKKGPRKGGGHGGKRP